MNTNRKKNTGGEKSPIVFYLLIAAVTLWFLAAQIFGSDQSVPEISEKDMIFTGSFTWEKADGSIEPISVPGRYELPAGETMTIRTTFPSNYDATAIAIRSSLQDIRFYIDGELRAEYSTRTDHSIRKNSSSGYAFCDTSAQDAGKELVIELTTYTNNYSGVVNTIYNGDRSDIWRLIYQDYGLATVIAFFLLFAGFVTVLFGAALGIVYHSRFDMEYLGWCIMMASAWMLGESKIRQLLVPNQSALGTLCFLIILLAPLPLLLYVNSIQCGRHKTIFSWLSFAAILNFFVCTLLQLTGIADYIQTMPIAHIVLIITLVVMLVTFLLDARHGYMEKDHLLLFGFFIVIAVVSIESISVYMIVSISGIFIGVGTLIFLFINIIRTIRHVHELEVAHQEDKFRQSQEQLEKISLQIMQMLSTTLEAKDEYTKGHSLRVAEYSARLAKALGWSDEDVQNLKQAAYLHDIGKVGIPDTILNKPAKLSEEEYAIIKQHPLIGAEILKNISLTRHVTEIARSHHERYDGKGYPDGLKGEEIPIHARIVALADSYDAMNSRRIYRAPLPQNIIREEIAKNRGTQFDPKLTDLFLKLMDHGELKLEDTPTVESLSPIPGMELEVSRFVSDLMSTLRSQEDAENFDLLTGLPLRNVGERLAAQLLQEHNGCLIFLDMDNLKQINDIYGNKAGDRALRTLGHLLSECFEDSVVCRLGGDEFLVFLADVSQDSATEEIQKLFDRFRTAKANDLEIRSASISAGLCMCSKGDSFEDRYSKADKALYYVKQNGKEGFFFYQQMEQEYMKKPSSGKDLALVAKALQESGMYHGALDLDYRDFARIFEYINNLWDRHLCHCYLVMVTLETAPDHVPYIENIEQALECMEQAIREKIRKVDICTRYSSMQYLIILFEPEESQIPKVMDRIFIQYYKLYGKNNFYPRYDYTAIQNESKNEESRRTD